MKEHKYTIQTTGGEYVRAWCYSHEVGIRSEHFPLEPDGGEAEMGRLRQKLSEDGVRYGKLEGGHEWIPADKVEAIHFGDPAWSDSHVARVSKLE